MENSAAARIGQLSRNPAGIKAVRAARSEIGVEVELVFLDRWRAIVVAGFSGLTLQPRDLSGVEHQLVGDTSQCAVDTQDGFVVAVSSIPGGLLALSSGTAVTDGQAKVLGELACDLHVALSDTRADAPEFPARPVPAAVLANQRDAVLVLDKNLVIRYCNNAVVTMFGWAPEDLVGREATAIVHPDDLDLALDAITRLTNAQEVYRVRLRLLNAVGDWAATSVTAIDQSANDQVGGLIVSLRRTDYEHESLRTLANLEGRVRNDQLTGLPSRFTLRDSLLARTALWATEEDTSGLVAGCSFGIDRFKTVNDIYGHRVGDEVLRLVAERLASFAADDDLLGRTGGDEFVLVLTNPDRATRASVICEHIRQRLSMPYEADGNKLHLTASVGVTTQDRDSVAAEALFKDADTALFRAKDRGRDQVTEFDTDLAVESVLSQAQLTMVRSALIDGGLHMHYQPIVDRSGTMLGAEALARCVDPEGEIHLPGDFMKAIAGTSMMVKLDRQAFEQSCAMAATLEARWPDADLYVSANFSANTLAQSDFSETVLAAMTKAGVSASSVCIEITETAAFDAGPLGVAALSELRDAGIRIALDDFGTGYSSLAHMRDLPLTSVKIDRSFVKELHAPGPEQTIARGISELARSLGFSIIAEGVETAEQLDAASVIGIEAMQGWYFDKALEAQILLQRLEAQYGEAYKPHEQ